jgi:hypothetical protein
MTDDQTLRLPSRDLIADSIEAVSKPGCIELHDVDNI